MSRRPGRSIIRRHTIKRPLRAEGSSDCATRAGLGQTRVGKRLCDRDRSRRRSGCWRSPARPCCCSRWVWQLPTRRRRKQKTFGGNPGGRTHAGDRLRELHCAVRRPRNVPVGVGRPDRRRRSPLPRNDPGLRDRHRRHPSPVAKTGPRPGGRRAHRHPYRRLRTRLHKLCVLQDHRDKPPVHRSRQPGNDEFPPRPCCVEHRHREHRGAGKPLPTTASGSRSWVRKTRSRFTTRVGRSSESQGEPTGGQTLYWAGAYHYQQRRVRENPPTRPVTN